MASQAYWTWLKAGEPYRLATPIKELRAWAVANGVEVLGTIGNDAHLMAEPPLDHTPFSSTPWPVPLPGYVVTAIDLANEDGLGRAIRDMARAGKAPWLKYIIYAHESYSHWDNFAKASYSDDAHVHISIRSDWCDRSIGAFDPRGEQMDWKDRFENPGVPGQTDTAETFLTHANMYAFQALQGVQALTAKVDGLASAVADLKQRLNDLEIGLPSTMKVQGSVMWE